MTREIAGTDEPYLRERTCQLLQLVREPSSAEREVLESNGFVGLLISRRSIAQLVSADPDYFRSGGLDHAGLWHAEVRRKLRDYIPPVEMEVFLNPTQLVIPDSSYRSQEPQLEMIDQYRNDLKKRLPGLTFVMLPATGYVQADQAYSRKFPDQLLFSGGSWARTLEQMSVPPYYAACVGRYRSDVDRSDVRLRVEFWFVGHGYGDMGAVPAGVFL